MGTIRAPGGDALRDPADDVLTIGGADAGATQSLAVGPAVRAPVAGGPRILPAGVVPPVIAAYAYRPTDIALGGNPYGVNRPQLVVSLDNAWARTWQDRLNEAGSGSMTLANDDPDLADIHDGDLVRFELYGTATMSWFVADRERTTAAVGEELEQVTKLSGPAHVSLLAQSLVYPVRAPIVWPPPDSRALEGVPIEEDRIFAWSAIGYPDSTWGAPEIYLVDPHEATPAWWGLCDAWPPGNAHWIWAPGYTQLLAPGGSCYFRRQFDLAEPTKVILYAAADDSLQLWLDGALVINRDEWFNTAADIQTVTVDLDAGTHCIAARAHNSEAGPVDGINPAAFICAVYAIDTNGTVASAPFLVSDDDWKMLAYPSEPPTITPGQVALTVLGEANQRRGHPVISAAFSADVDSDGNPWERAGEISTKVGTDLLTFFRELAATYVDFWMEPGSYTLHLWNKDRRGVTRTVNLHLPTNPMNPASGNLGGLVHHRVT
jgi:hypothetical protein